MANMSYCRFHNTLHDLLDCNEALVDFLDNSENVIESAEERRKAKQLIQLCHDIADNYEPEDIDRKAEELSQEDEYDEEEEEEEEN